MRRILALVICIFLFILPVNAANTATSVRTTAKVNANGACEVTIEADIRLDEPARGLKFPLGKDIQSVTLNGTSAPVTQSEGITSVNLSHLDGKTGLYSYSAISRQEMVERIMEYAGLEFSLEEFYANDVRDASNNDFVTSAVQTAAELTLQNMSSAAKQMPPKYMGESPLK